jgi:asparagine synthetase B (glutamine-hydrolysing)
MGGLYLAVYKVCKQNLNIDFVRSFMDLKFRGLDDTHWSIESTVNMKNLSPQQTNIIQANLSRDQIQKYTQYNFVYGFHRSCINDDTFNGSQPFEDPIKNQTIKYPDLNTRPLRKLLCNGEIYNYDLLKTKYNFGSKDLSSSSDVEIFLPLYIQNRASIANPEDAIKTTLAQIDGDFSMILTENVNSYDLSTVKTFVARDFLGIKPLFYVYNKNCSGSQDFYLFVSEIKALPRLLMNNESYVVGQVPPGTFWSFDASVNTGLPVFTNYYDLQQFTKLEACVFADTSPDKLSELYQLISDTVISSVTSRYSL